MLVEDFQERKLRISLLVIRIILAENKYFLNENFPLLKMLIYGQCLLIFEIQTLHFFRLVLLS